MDEDKLDNTIPEDEGYETEDAPSQGGSDIRTLLADKLATLLPEGANADEIADALLSDPDIQSVLGLSGEEVGEEEPAPEDTGESTPPEDEPETPAEEPPQEGAPPFMPKRGESNAMRAFRAQFAK